MAEYLAPGIYIEEFDSGVKAMEGVGTSTAGFVGLAERGPVDGRPTLVTSFANGGSSLYVMRVVPPMRKLPAAVLSPVIPSLRSIPTPFLL